MLNRQKKNQVKMRKNEEAEINDNNYYYCYNNTIYIR